jgi:MFS family permease
MLKNFDPSLPDSTISWQVGMMQAAFTVTQFLTAIAWGRAADSEMIGRKKVLMVGLVGTMISALGFGFSKSFIVAMCFRSLGGALNGNVGVMRTVSFILHVFEILSNHHSDDIRDNQGKALPVKSIYGLAYDF